MSLNEILEKMIKAEFTRKLSNFNFQWTKTLYQNNLYKIAFFLTFSRAKDVISHLQYFVWEPEKINKCQISQTDMVHMKFLEFYLCFHNSCEI